MVGEIISFDEQTLQKTKEVNEVLSRYLPKEEGLQKTVIEAMNYSVNAGGKRLRPVIMKEFYEAFGGRRIEVIEPFMAAIEMIHTYSLVHDDLPAMDNDMLRRGKPTTHVQFGEAMGILAGDGLLNYAVETALKAADAEAAKNVEIMGRVIKAAGVLFNKSGIFGMIGGQTVDVENTGRKMSEEQLLFMYDLKTGALIEASMMVGGILAGASGDKTELLENIAKKVGLAFQIQDDILDVSSDEATLGKNVFSDADNNKMTYVSVYGVEKAQEEVKKLTNEAVGLYDSLGVKNDFLRELLIRLAGRKY